MIETALTSGALIAICIFFIKRYISKMDKDVEKLEASVSRLTNRVTKVDTKLAEYLIVLNQKLSEVDEKSKDAENEIVKGIENIKYDIRQYKAEVMKQSESQNKEYGRIIYKIMNEHEVKINKIINVLRKKK